MDGGFDYLIVGGGSAGCIVARVLAERGFRIGIVEPVPANTPRRLPADYPRSFGSQEDWGWSSTPQEKLANRRLRQPRGRGPGGSTRINAMIWNPPNQADLSMLHRHGGTLWATERFKQSLERVTAWVRPTRPAWVSEVTTRFLNIGAAGVDPPHAYLRMADRCGRRTAADVLREQPGPDHDRVRWIDGQAERILFENSSAGDDLPTATAVAVRVAASHAAEPLLAARGIILCAGAFGSPDLLFRSGVGPAADLEACRVPHVIVNEAVGRNLTDHLVMPIVFQISPKDRFPHRLSVRDLARWQVSGMGPASSNLAEAGGIFTLPGRSESDDGSDELNDLYQVHVTPTHYLLHPSDSAPAAMSIGVNVCRPDSRGRITFRREGDEIIPLIDPGYLSVENDVARTALAVQGGRAMASSSPLKSVLGQELVPGPKRQSAESVYQSIRRYSQSLYHPVGTCRMSSYGDGVVDQGCHVHGTRQLYVIDASILPEIPLVNPNATVMAVALHAAQLID